MVEVVGHEPGGFCFLESGSRDVESSIGFYGALFGWDAERRPLPGGGSYTRFLRRGTPVAGVYEVVPERDSADVPSQWLTYVSVVDAVATLERALAMGAVQLGDVVAVPGVVTVAEFIDPDGAACGLWQPAQHVGAGYVNEPGALSWSDLVASNIDGASSFYGELFGWCAEATSLTTYRFSGRDGITRGGMTTEDTGGRERARWRAHVGVDDLDEAVALTVDLGGFIEGRPASIPRVGRCQEVRDPNGTTFALIELARP